VESFESLLERNRGRLTRVARAYAPGADAQDLYQEILLQIWKSLGRFAGRSHVDTWAYRIALNTALTWRRRGARQLATRDADGIEPAGGSDPREPLRILEDFLATLDKTDRALLLLYLEDLTYHDIAEILGITENHVGVKVNRLKQSFIDRHIRGPR
jgi:RNA polymerase sigma-70 factor, ECF subfamily